MAEHYPRGTESVTAWCKKCQRMTEHRVDHPAEGLPGAGRLGPCIDPNHSDRSVLQVFVSTLCLCGKKKERNTGFCHRCYFRLPKAMQQELWKRFGEGFEQAFAGARKFLDEQPKPAPETRKQGDLFQ